MKAWRLWSGGLFIGGVDCGGCGDAEATVVCVTCVVGTHYPLCALGIIMGWLTWRGSAPTIHELAFCLGASSKGIFWETKSPEQTF